MANVYIAHQNFTKSHNFSGNGTFPILKMPPLTLEELESLRLATIFCYLIIGVVSLLGNTSVLAIVYLNSRMRTAANFYIVNMAISDLLYVIIVIPVVLEETFTRSGDMWAIGVVGEILCRLVPFVRDVSFTVSILSMVAIALDRYFVIVYPLKEKPFYLKKKIVIPLIWLVSLSYFAVYWYIYRIVPPNFCIPQWPSKNWFVFQLCLVTLYFVFPLLVITVLYSVIIYKIKRQVIPGQRTSEMEKARRNRNKSITKLGVFIVVWFFISWVPYHIFNLLNIFLKGRLPGNASVFLNYVISNVFGFLSTTSVASNPIVCYACSTNFRDCLIRLLRCSIVEQRQRTQATLNSYTNGRRIVNNEERNENGRRLSNCVFERDQPGDNASSIIETSL